MKQCRYGRERTSELRSDLEFGLFVGQPFRLQPASRLSRCATSFSDSDARWLEHTKQRIATGGLRRFESRLKGGCRQDCLPHLCRAGGWKWPNSRSELRSDAQGRSLMPLERGH